MIQCQPLFDLLGELGQSSFYIVCRFLSCHSHSPASPSPLRRLSDEAEPPHRVAVSDVGIGSGGSHARVPGFKQSEEQGKHTVICRRKFSTPSRSCIAYQMKVANASGTNE